MGVLDGIGGSSKSEFLAILCGILGQQACAQLRTAHLLERFEIGSIASASFLSGSDVPGDFLCRPGAQVIKSMVGNDLLDCEAKGGNVRVRIRGNFNVMVVANTTLHILLDGDYEAWRRRLVRIYYTKQYGGKRIPEISKYLLGKEGSGILNFFLQGALKVLRDFDSCGDIVLSERHQKLVDTMLAESQSLALYLERTVQRVDYAEGNGVTTQEILQGYLDFCRKEHWQPQIETFATELPTLMAKLFGASPTHNLERFGKKNKRGYRQVAFINDQPDESAWEQ
jgi:phage/plasmid-associated DNA primase